MKRIASSPLATLTLLGVLYLSGYALGSGYASDAVAAQAATVDSRWFPPMAASQEPGITLESPAQLMQMKMQEVCARADRDQDGYLARSEYNALGKPRGMPDRSFRTADANHDGHLSLTECERVLGRS